MTSPSAGDVASSPARGERTDGRQSTFLRPENPDREDA